MAITEDYTIIMHFPILFRPGRLLKGESPLQFEPEDGTRFAVYAVLPSIYVPEMGAACRGIDVFLCSVIL